MATVTLFSAPTNSPVNSTAATTATSGHNFRNWAGQISRAFSLLGWIQQTDGGQAVFPTKSVAITNASGNGTTATFTYIPHSNNTNATTTTTAQVTASQVSYGTSLAVGDKILIANCTTAGFNGTFTITSLPQWNTFTVTNATNTTEAETIAFGDVVTFLSITNAAGNGTVATYTYTLVSGAALRIGMSIVITGCTTAGFNGTFSITALPSGSTFTVNNPTNVTEAETATGTLALSPTPTGNSTVAGGTVYEIWKSADALTSTLPMFVRMDYGNFTAPTASATIYLTITVGTATDGSGNIVGSNNFTTANVGVIPQTIGSTAKITLVNGSTTPDNANAVFSYLSGTSGTLTFALWPGSVPSSATAAGCFVMVERSKDSSGNDTGSYFTLVTLGANVNNASTLLTQSTVISGVNGFIAVAENHPVFLAPYGPSSGEYNGSIYLSPLYPIIGFVGNPHLGILIGKASDWTDTSSFQATLYNTAHTYMAFTAGGTSGKLGTTSGLSPANSSSTWMLAIRFE